MLINDLASLTKTMTAFVKSGCTLMKPVGRDHWAAGGDARFGWGVIASEGIIGLLAVMPGLAVGVYG